MRGRGRERERERERGRERERERERERGREREREGREEVVEDQITARSLMEVKVHTMNTQQLGLE